MQNILRLIVLFSAIVCFTACSEDDDHARTVSFKRAVYILSSNQAIEVEIGLSEGFLLKFSVRRLKGKSIHYRLTSSWWLKGKIRQRW